WKKRNFVKGWVVLFYFLCSIIPAKAQFRDQLNLPNHDDKRFHIGIIIMGGVSRFHISQHPHFLDNDSVLVTSPENSMIFGIGGMSTFKLTDRFSARVIFPQFLFGSRTIRYNLSHPVSGESREMIKSVESMRFGLPVQIKFQSDRIQNFRVYMVAGVKAEFDLTSKAKAKNAEDLIKLKSTDFGIEAGIGFNFYMPFFILSPEIKISNGLSDSHSRDANLKFSSAIDRMNNRMIIFSLIFEG
ncbi:MAG TPA: outer membrane beta-barrel protein, partial [Chitinophagaceae bacterium]|nr:outer membrane beta-barrel protein [Chitinophagaceae bacterium]